MRAYSQELKSTKDTVLIKSSKKKGRKENEEEENTLRSARMRESENEHESKKHVNEKKRDITSVTVVRLPKNIFSYISPLEE